MQKRQSSGTLHLPEPRSLTDSESSLIEWLLDHADHQYAGYKAQIPDLTVVSHCKCGCPTVNFALNGQHSRMIGGSPIADFQAEVDGMVVGVMLFAYEQQVTSLEVYSFAGHDTPFGLPDLSSLRTLDF